MDGAVPVLQVTSITSVAQESNKAEIGLTTVHSVTHTTPSILAIFVEGKLLCPSDGHLSERLW